MKIYEMDYLSKIKALLQESFKLKKYKAMHPVLAVLTFIPMLPFFFITLYMTAILAIFAFIYKVIMTPIKFLHSLLNAEGKEVKHGTQVIVYLVAWPYVFLSYSLSAIMLVGLAIGYAFLSLVTYIWTLGGYKFHIFVDKYENIAINVKGRYFALPIAYALVSYIGFGLIPIVHALVTFVNLYNNYLEAQFIGAFAIPFVVYILLSLVFTILYSYIGFARHPELEEEIEEPKEAPAVAEPAYVSSEKGTNPTTEQTE